MKALAFVTLLALCVPAFGLMSPDLQGVIARGKATDLIPVDIVLKEQMDSRVLTDAVKDLPKPQRRAMVAQIMSAFSAEHQRDVREYLEAMGKQGKVADIKSFWLSNAMYCRATVEVIEALDRDPQVYYVDYDLKPIELERPGYSPAPAGREIAWGVSKINAPQVWALGFTGAGVVVGIVDTGVRHTHLDLHDHIWTDPNYPNHGYDFEFNDFDPMDENSHGTHCAGSVASDGTAGSQCGVAPDAQMLCCKVRTVADSVAEWQVFAAWEFVVSPPLSPTHGADAMTMSLGWQISWNPHQSTWRTNANTVGAAGVIQCVAAGNESSIAPPNSLRCPGNVPSPWRHPQNGATGAQSNIISIGATDINDAIASFSSLGPVTWQSIPPFNDYTYPPGLTKPDVCAPGVNIKSLDYSSDNGYVDGWNGTSMATPHAAGTVALMLSKNPNLTQVIVDSILQMTAVDLGAAGKDNTFGAGRIDALAAVNATPYPFALAPLAYSIDDPGGNHNHLWESSEQVSLIVPIRNQTGSTVTNAVATISESDPYASIINGTANLGTIAPYDTVDAVFVVLAAAGTPLMHLVNFTLNLSHTGGNQNYPLDVYINPLPTLVYQSDSTVGGNNNGVLDPSETANLLVKIKNNGPAPATNVTSTLFTSSPLISILDASSNYGNIAVNDTANNAADLYTVLASGSAQIGDSVLFNVALVSGLYNDTIQFYVNIGKKMPTDTGYYYTYWSGGPYVQCPVYSWYAIDTTQTLHPGTSLNLSDDAVVRRALPFTFRYYGVAYNRISISSNGFVTLDSATSSYVTNYGLPGTSAPPTCIAGMWDDLDPGNGGAPSDIYVYNNTTDHKYVVEFFRVEHYPSGYQETFEFFLLDPAYYPTPTGDGEIIIQYMYAMQQADNTLGIQNSARTIGIQYYLDGTYNPLGVPVTNQFALKYTTVKPSLVGVEEADGQANLGTAFGLRVYPSIAKRDVRINYCIGQSAKGGALKIYDASGRVVKSFTLGPLPCALSLIWHGTDNAGRFVPAGVYFVRLETEGQQAVQKAVLLR